MVPEEIIEEYREKLLKLREVGLAGAKAGRDLREAFDKLVEAFDDINKKMKEKEDLLPKGESFKPDPRDIC